MTTSSSVDRSPTHMRLAEQGVVWRLGEVREGDLRPTVRALGTRLVELGLQQHQAATIAVRPLSFPHLEQSENQFET